MNNKSLKEKISEGNGNVLEHFGFNINMHAESAVEIVCMMLVDDGLNTGTNQRSRRNNILNPNMKICAVAVEKHRDLDVICGLVLVQGYYVKGEAHPLEKQVQTFLAEEDDVDFVDPEGTTGAYKQTSRVDVDGLVATKIVEREYFMKG